MRGVIVCGVVGLILGLAAREVPQALRASSLTRVWGDGPTRDSMEPAAARGKALPPQRNGARVLSAAETNDASGARAPGEAEEAIDEVAEASAEVAQESAGAAEASGEAGQASAQTRADTAASFAPSNAAPGHNRLAQLASAGFPSDRAHFIAQREAALRRAQIDREFAATGTIRPLNASSPAAIERQLKTELNDDEYQSYLSSLGQRTRIRVGTLESHSVAASAGMEPGDEILAYAGQRVFTLSDLNTLMLKTPEGQIVPTTVLRNGQTLQLYVTGGALGISTK